MAQPAEAGRRCFPLAALGSAFDPTGYDVVVYALGIDPEGEVDVLRLALDHPGVVHLDGGADLAATYVAWARHQPDPAGAMRESLRAMYGDRVHGTFVHGDPLVPDDLVRLGALGTAAVARRARVVVVDDDAAAAAVRFDVGPATPAPDVRVGALADVVLDLLPR